MFYSGHGSQQLVEVHVDVPGFPYLDLETDDHCPDDRKVINGDVLGGDVLLQEAVKVPVGGQEQQHPVAKGPEGGRSETDTSPSRLTDAKAFTEHRKSPGALRACFPGRSPRPV